MADVTGALAHSFGGQEYSLRLTLGGIAKLQAKHGNDLGGLLSGKVEQVPPFGIMLDMIAVSLEKGHKLAPDEAAELADEMMTADKGVFERLMKAAFPDAVAGNVPAPKGKAKA